MAEQLRGPFEKFVTWRQCAAVMQKETLVYCFLKLILFNEWKQNDAKERRLAGTSDHTHSVDFFSPSRPTLG
jgi:hypothetical protein